MSDPGKSQLDWDSIFHRARHHMLRRVLLVGGIAGLAALLLFSGGTASWKLARAPKAKPAKVVPKKHHHPGGRGHPGGGTGGGDDGGGGKGGDRGGHHPPPPPPPPPPPVCETEGAAVGQQYCDAEEAPKPEPTKGGG